MTNPPGRQNQRTNLKLQPQSLESEQAVLGAILLDERAIHRVETLSPKHFYADAHQAVFRAMRGLQMARLPIDPVTLSERLSEDNALVGIGGAAYISELLDGVGTAANIEHYAEIIRAHAARRDAIAFANRLSELAYGAIEPTENLYTMGSEYFSAFKKQYINKRIVSLHEKVKEWCQNIEGPFTINDVLTDLCLKRDDQANIRQILSRLTQEKVVTRLDTGKYRRVEKLKHVYTLKKQPDQPAEFVLLWPYPFNFLHEQTKVFPRDMVAIAGAPNAGKTTMALKLIEKNLPHATVQYLTSESSEQKLIDTLEGFSTSMDFWMRAIEDGRLEIGRHEQNPIDVIDPSKDIVIIDYMVIVEDAYKIEQKFLDLTKALTNGIIVVCIQKRPGEKELFGVGASASIRTPTIALSLDQEGGGVFGCRVAKAKALRHRRYNLDNKKVLYRIEEGAEYKEYVGGGRGAYGREKPKKYSDTVPF